MKQLVLFKTVIKKKDSTCYLNSCVNFFFWFKYAKQIIPMKKQAIYEVPVIPNNLRHEETIVQIADVLGYLCQVFDDILTKVNTRIDDNKSRLTNLTARINNSTEKITKLTGTKKATQVFSSSKYPATEVYQRYKSVFTNNNENDVNFEKTSMKFKDPILTEQPLEKLQFYHVKISDKTKQKSKYADVEEGLGDFPNDIESINELILFNTSKNPYKNYVMSDPLQVTQSSKEMFESNVPGPDAAPLSITQRAALNRSIGENYFYSPGLGDVPTIDVPLDLPDLPGIADDLRYLMESGPGIAPSVTTTPIVPDLPSIVQSPSGDAKDERSLTESLPLPPLPSPSVVQDVPVVAPKVDVAEIVNVPEVVPTSVVVVDEPDVVKKTIKKVAPVLPVVEDARASLMAAIRKAGGAKNLRNTEPKTEEKSSMGSNNLMADLNAKLALRRKGISGLKGGDRPEMSSALTKVSAMIPPPQANNDLNESTNTEDEEWDE